MISKDNGVLIDNFHSYKDFKLILTKKTISSPELQEEYVDVPGRDGPIDLSEVLTGTVKFKERTISLSFFSLSPAQNWATEYSKLQNKLLGPVLGIGDPKTDGRIDFVGGIRGMDELVRRGEQDCAVAFAMYPTSIAELFAVADAGLLMPPKSTWFEPKLRSGLFIHEI